MLYFNFRGCVVGTRLRVVQRPLGASLFYIVSCSICEHCDSLGLVVR